MINRDAIKKGAVSNGKKYSITVSAFKNNSVLKSSKVLVSSGV